MRPPTATASYTESPDPRVAHPAKFRLTREGEGVSMRRASMIAGAVTAIVLVGPAELRASERLEIRGVYPGMTIDQLRALPPLNSNGDLMCSNEPGADAIFQLSEAQHRYGGNPNVAFCTIIDRSRDRFAAALTTELHTTRADIIIEAVRINGQNVVAIAAFSFPAVEQDSVVQAYTAKYGTPATLPSGEVRWRGANGDMLSIVRVPSGSERSSINVVGVTPFLERKRVLDSFVPPRL